MENWKIQYPEMISHYIAPKPFLGEEDAKNEWNDSKEPEITFLHTDIYNIFKKPENIYLFGRRGSGKTAIVRMLRYEIRHKLIDNYNFVWLIDQEETYNDLAINIRFSPLSSLPKKELIHVLKENWRWVIYISAMCSVCKEYSYRNIPEISKILKFLQDSNLINEGKSFVKPLKMLSDILQTALEEVEYNELKIALAIAKITKKLITPDFFEAKEALIKYLKKNDKRSLVIIDSVERYELNDKISEAVVTALIETALDFYESNHNERIFVKAAFPSEIYPHLNPLNKEKTESKNLFIIWQYKHLVCLLAKRFHRYINTESSISYYSLDEFLVAKDYLYKYLPASIKSAPNIPFDTLSYIISHTQKKPRQVILLFNIILTLAEEIGISPDKLTEEAIIKGIHARLDILCDGAVDIYNDIYPNANKFIHRTLLNIKTYFLAPELDKRLKEVQSIKKDSELSNEEIKQLFLEAGIIGIAESPTDFNKEKFFMEGLFEYQIKGKITLNNETKCVIHPMFFQQLQVNADMDVLIYPKPSEIEEKETLKYKMD